MHEPVRPSYAFGPFVLDASKRLLLREGDPVPLAPKVLDTLLALIEHRGDVISKEQLLSRVWGDTVVEEGGLARNISLLRKTLGEKPDEHRYIVTVPARGYRFVADVREDAAAAPPREEPSDHESARSQNREADESFVRRPPQWTAIWKAVAVLSLVLGLAAAALVWPSVWSSSFGPAPLSQARLVRLTSTGLNIDPALSPDGSLVAFASDRARAGNLDVWVQPLRGDTPTRITSGDGDEVEPSFSPDGSLIAFAGGETGGIYTVGALGGEPRLLVRGARTRTPRFSPDGRSILYWIGQTAWIVVPGTPTIGATGALAVVAASGGEPRMLAREFASARYGIWSPDGTRILFLGERANDRGASLDWYVIDADGEGAVRTGALEALRAAPVNGTPIPGAWTAAGVVFTTGEATSNVWQLPVSPQTGRVAGGARRLTFGTALERSAAVSADGHIAFASVTENVDVWRVPLDSPSGGARGAPERVTEDAAPDRVLNVSANGRTLAFRSSRTGRDEVWLRDLQTGAERQLTQSGASVARVSPDGLKVAVERDLGEHVRVQLHDLSGAQPSTLCDDCTSSGGWSSDGSRLLIGRRRGATQALVMLDVGSRREVEIARHAQWNIVQAHFSPDDQWVTFQTTNAPDLRQVYAVPALSGAPVPADAWVPIAPDFGIFPSWSSSGTGIYHFSFRDGYMCAWLQQVDPRSKRAVGAPRPVHHFHEPRLRVAARATASNDVVDGMMYVTLTETTGNIWMLDATAGSRH
jgi:Tol biopolymer transport system component/DNA-binding winged helix-turn-helix (wHTH) protein